MTGNFADVLNWAGTSEDAFNTQLQATSSSTERAKLVLQELARQGLAEVGQAWRDTNADIVAANDSQRRFEAAQAGWGRAFLPLRDKLRDISASECCFSQILLMALPVRLTNWEKSQIKLQRPSELDWKRCSASMGRSGIKNK